MDCPSDCVELADETCKSAETSSFSEVVDHGAMNLSTEVSDLGPRHSELHLD